MRQRANFPCPLLWPALLLVLAASSFSAASAEAPKWGSSFSVTDENDAWSNFVGLHQDRHYTHGIKLTYLGGDDDFTNLTSHLNHLFAWGSPPSAGNLGFVAGQSMFTPEKILDPEPIPTDRPYAGWLYAGMIYQRRKEISAHYATMENFEINLGIVGPDSMADDTQILIHHWRFPEDIPQGWENQIHDEPGLVLKYAYLWRWSPNDETARYFDLIPRVGGEAGNVFTFATAGVTARLGLNLPADFGMQIIDSPASGSGGMTPDSPRFACYAFAGADGRCVLHDITLDGNTFRSSPSVHKYYFVDDLNWGLAVDFGRHVEVSYAQVTRSKEFVGQIHKDVFGSINLKLKFSF